MKYLTLTLCVLFSCSLYAQEWQTDTLSQARRLIGIGSAQNKIIFAGGKKERNLDDRTIDIYDEDTDLWSTKRSPFGIGNTGMTAVSGDNYVIYFQRGSPGRFGVYDPIQDTVYRVDWEDSRSRVVPVIANDKVFFAGGRRSFSQGGGISDQVDIYDIPSDSWSSRTLREARDDINAISAGDKVFFLGGAINSNLNDFSAAVDVYDMSTDQLVTNSLTLSEPRRYIGLAVDTLNNQLYAAGGAKSNNSTIRGSSNVVDVINLSDLSSYALEIPSADRFVSAEVFDREIVFLGGQFGQAQVLTLADTTFRTESLGVGTDSIPNFFESESHNGKAYFITSGEKGGRFVFIYDQALGYFEPYDLGDDYIGKAIGILGPTIYVTAGSTFEFNDSRLVFSLMGFPVSTFPVPNFSPIELGVYPNPTSMELTLKLDGWPTGNTQVTITDFTGRVFRSRKFFANGVNAIIPVVDLPQGNYVVGLRQANRYGMAKFIKR